MEDSGGQIRLLPRSVNRVRGQEDLVLRGGVAVDIFLARGVWGKTYTYKGCPGH